MKCLFIHKPSLYAKLTEDEKAYYRKSIPDERGWVQIAEDHELYPWLLIKTNKTPMEINNGKKFI